MLSQGQRSRARGFLLLPIFSFSVSTFIFKPLFILNNTVMTNIELWLICIQSSWFLYVCNFEVFSKMRMRVWSWGRSSVLNCYGGNFSTRISPFQPVPVPCHCVFHLPSSVTCLCSQSPTLPSCHPSPSIHGSFRYLSRDGIGSILLWHHHIQLLTGYTFFCFI